MGTEHSQDQELRVRSDMSVELIKHSAADSDVIWAARSGPRTHLLSHV